MTGAAVSTSVELWWLDTESLNADALRLATWPLITQDERLRHNRYRFEIDKHEYLATRWLARTMLSRYVDMPAAELEFVVRENGKPALLQRPVEFNLANTRGAVVCAVARGRVIGVDIERLERSPAVFDSVSIYYSSREQSALAILPDAQRMRRFFEIWTLKEAYLKARGAGLRIPLDLIEFEIFDNATIGVHMHPSLRDNPMDWEFALHHLSATHIAATAVQRGGASCNLICRKLEPEELTR